MIAAMAAAFICAAPLAGDGDGLRCGRERIRLANIDAPELPGSSRCSPASVERLRASRNPAWCDYALGARSAAALRVFLAGGPVMVQRVGIDPYGRTLALVSVNGQDAGRYLVKRGLARRWQ